MFAMLLCQLARRQPPKLAHLQLIACLVLQSEAGAHDAARCGQARREMERLNAVNLAGIYSHYIRL